MKKHFLRDGDGRRMWESITYEEKYLSAMIQMAKENFGENDIADEKFIRNQYFANPAGDALIALAYDREKEQIAGQYVVCPMRFLVNGEPIICANSLNTLTKKEYRRQGIFTGLAETTYQKEAKMGHLFCYGAPNPNSYPGFVGRLSFQELGRIPLYLRPLYPSAMVKDFLHSEVLSILAKPFDFCFKAHLDEQNDQVNIVHITEENLPIVDALWANIRGKYQVMNIRDADYINFRYLHMPQREYFPYVALYQDEAVAFAVGRITEVSGMRCGMLVDYVFKSGFQNEGEELLRFMLNIFRLHGASIAGSLMLAHAEESIVLKRCGFFRCPEKLEPQPFPLILKLFDKAWKNQGICSLENWFFTMGDYDAV